MYEHSTKASKKRVLLSIAILSLFIFCHYFMRNFWGENWTSIISNLDQDTMLLLMPAKYLFIYGPLLLIAPFLVAINVTQTQTSNTKQFEFTNSLDILGLNTSDHKSYLNAAIMCCLPMAFGYAHLSSEINLALAGLITGSFYAGFFEELVFRAALFGLLFRFCGWGFVPAALVSSVIFGLGHIYQGSDITSALLAISITTIAGTWFSWLYCECGYRIWFPMWMHIFMNAAYGIFNMSGGAAGDLEGNLFKSTSIILSIVYIHLLVRRGKQREVTLATLWKNKTNKSCLS